MGDTSSRFVLKSGFWKCENPENQDFEDNFPSSFHIKNPAKHILDTFLWIFWILKICKWHPWRYESITLFLTFLQADLDPQKLNLKNSITEFFTKKELKDMGAYERAHLRNLRENYEMMKFLSKLLPFNSNLMFAFQDSTILYICSIWHLMIKLSETKLHPSDFWMKIFCCR